MALLDADGFDHYTVATEAGWSGGTITTSNPRTGAQCLQVTTAVTKNLGNAAARCYGGGIRPITAYLAGALIMAFRDGITVQVGIYQNGDGTVSCKNGDGTVLATSAQTITLGSYQFVEFKAEIGNTLGYFDFKVDGVSWMSASNVDTQNSGNAFADTIVLGNPSTVSTNWDDVYVISLPVTGPNNDFLGDIEVIPDYANASGSFTQWTALGNPSNYQNINETLLDYYTTYNQSVSTGFQDSYNYTNISTGSPAIKGIVLAMSGATSLLTGNTPSGTTTITPFHYYAGTAYMGTTVTPSTGTGTFQQYRSPYDINLGTGVAWTATSLNNSEFGVSCTVNPQYYPVVSQLVVLIVFTRGTTHSLSARISASSNMSSLVGITRGFSATIGAASNVFSSLGTQLFDAQIAGASNFQSLLTLVNGLSARVSGASNFQAELTKQNNGQYSIDIEPIITTLFYTSDSNPYIVFVDESNTQAKITPFAGQSSPPETSNYD